MYYYKHLEEDAMNFAKSYSQRLTKAAEARQVVNELLEEKLTATIRTVALYHGKYSNGLLQELAHTLGVDEIDYYNPQGELIYSNMDVLIGWKAYEGHPVHNFMNGNSESLIEDIRQDSITGDYYKYSYIKTSDGGIIQIGVKADEVRSYLDSFEIRQILRELKDVSVLNTISFIDRDFNVIGSNVDELIGQEITDLEIKEAIRNGEEYSFKREYGGEKEYRVYVPVYFEGNRIGTLVVGKSLRDAESFIKKATLISFVSLAIIYISLIITMISQYKKNKKLIELAYYDKLTGLPNMQYLTELLAEEIRKGSEKRAILLINCCDFRFVNMIYGFEYGDEILKELAVRIQPLTGEGRSFFRLTADRFILYVENYGSREELVSAAEGISMAFKEPFKVKGSEQHLNGQIGIVEIHSKYHSFDEILKDALISLSYIEDSDTVNYAFFDEAMESRLKREDLIEKELRAVIANNDSQKLYLEFQPQVDLKTGRVICFEALARMNIESLGFISPVEFIDVAERKQLIIPLGNFILKAACDFLKVMKDKGYNDVKVAVNVSGIQLLSGDFTNTVESILRETGIEKSSLELEITESVFLNNYDIVNKNLKNIREHKILIALDDFGTGYSSFSRLGELNIDIVKIDRYFITKISLKGRKEIITGEIISMAHKLGLEVVAEGVELHEQKEFLIENGCDAMQGYLFSKPLSVEKAIELLETNNSLG